MNILHTVVPMNASPELGINVNGNFIKIDGEAFATGAIHSLDSAPEVGAGSLRLKGGAAEGEFLSCVYSVQNFNDLVVSWNSDTPPHTHVEVFARVFLPEYSEWSDWISWGKWSPFIKRCCPDQCDTHERRDSDEQNGWVFANSYSGAGDSSLNVRGKLTANKIQLMARLRAEDGAIERPVLRRLAATFKNTNDENWQSGCSDDGNETLPEVLLDTPAISQMARDPEYGGVICSATCIAMQLCGAGLDVLPEDVTLMNYDYGFGGNGNWSFSAAAAGAFGAESYIRYGSFELMRQELSRGYAVGLSVKYSDEPGGALPYLENAPTTTPGHLIIIAGYYFSKELNEYVYYANDPAARRDDKVARREYRQSQLSLAWYRRAMYVVHDLEQNAGAFSRIRKSGKLLPLRGRDNIYAMVLDDGKKLELPYNFLFGKRRVFGTRGTIFITVSGEQRSLPEGVRRASANDTPYYFRAFPTDDGFIEIAGGVLEEAFEQGKTATLFVITSDGFMYSLLAGAENPAY